jgi:tRNA(Ile)-lysidine synthase
MTSSVTRTRTPRLVVDVAKGARTNRLLSQGDRVLVAVSGGPDSVALLSVLCALRPKWNLHLWVVHFHHGLRGTEADEDAEFVKTLSERLEVPYLCQRLPVRSTPAKGRSLQDTAHLLRYAALHTLSTSVGANKVALGHTRDDQSETLLMWLLRGAGTTGLGGMPAMREDRFIRPLLEATRDDILRYVREQGLSFREDSTNRKPVYLRNRIRHEVIPALHAFNPGLLKTLSRQASILREDDRYLDQVAEAELAGLSRQRGRCEWTLDRAKLLALPLALQRRLVRLTVRRITAQRQGPAFSAVSLVLDRVVRGKSGSMATIRGVGVIREYDQIRFAPASCDPTGHAVAAERHRIALPVPSTVAWPLTGQRVAANLVHSSVLPPRSGSVEPCVFVDPDRLTLDLEVRSWWPGDAFQPLGMHGRRKKLQDFFADLKIPRHARQRIPLVVAPEGIVWIAGHRIDHRFRITNDTTRLLRLTLFDDQTGSVE